MVRSTGFGWVIALLFLCLTVAPSASAQVAGGTISGTVSDPSKAVISGAQVTIRNTATGVTRTLTTNESGFYSAPNLLPGPYEVTVVFAGFNTAVEKLYLTVGAQAIVNVQLTMGATTENVEVAAEAPTLNMATSTLSATVGGQTVRELPLNGRDWTTLAALEAGVHAVDTQTQIVAGSNARPNRGWGNQLTFSGARPQQNNYRLDGISVNDYSGGGPGSTLGLNLGVDAIQEFNVVTGNASADYGKTSGGVFNAITRSGTNQFHGSAYEFLRNSAMDARNFFDGATVPPLRRNQFGASAGGPIRKDRTFIFGDYEGLRQSLSTTTVINVLSPAARSGQLASGSPSNVNIDPAVARYLNLFPIPNGAVKGDVGAFSFVAKQVTPEDFFTTRVDHKFSDADSVHGTLLIDNGQTTAPDSYDLTDYATTSRRKMITAEANHVFGPSLVNFARVGFSRTVATSNTPVQVLNPLANDPSLGFVPGLPVGTIQIGGLTIFPGGPNTGGINDYHFNSYQAYDDLFYVRRAHSLKFGVSLERIQANQVALQAPGGNFRFGSVRNFLLNQPQSFSAAIAQAGGIDLRQTIVGGYAQDDWRFRPHLTLNLGLRYEMATVPTEHHNKLATLDTLTDPQPRVGSPYFDNPTLRNFSPRLGFAWDTFGNGKTVIRGGIGIYDTLPLTYQFSLISTGTVPFAQIGSIGTASVLQGTFPTAALALLGPTKNSVAFVQQNPKRSYVEQWNFNIQRQVLHDLTFQVGYVGSHAVHQPFRDNDADMVLPVQTSPALIWPSPAGSGTEFNPNFGSINMLNWGVSSSYHSLNLALRGRVGRSLLLGTSYSWAKSIDNGSSSVTIGQFANSLIGVPIFWPNLIRGLSDFDIRHHLTVNYLWQVPEWPTTSAPLKWLAGGWQFGGIFRASTGEPFTLVVAGDPLGLGNGNPFDFPDRVVSAGCGSLVNAGNPNHYIKTECFAAPSPATRLGNSGRNIAPGPGIVNLDFSLFKDNNVRRISETFNVQFRAELFNVLNHPNFLPPLRPANQVLDATLAPILSAGGLTSTSTPSRQVQFALKLIW